MWLFEHTRAQAPQLSLSVLRLISQPSESLSALQSAKPEEQAPEHLLATQVTVAMLLPEQAWPQPPQLPTLVVVSTSQPSLCLFMLQSAKPAVQAPVHAPAV